MAYEIVHTFSVVDGADTYTYDIEVDYSAGTILLFRRDHAPPPSGDITQAELGYNEGDTISQRCTGTTLKKVIASFTYPYATFVTELNSSACGYTPPVCAIDLTATPQNATDGQNNGRILITGYGATEYSTNGIIWQSSPIFEMLFPGSYYVYARNTTCEKSDLVEVGNDISTTPQISTTLIPYQDSNKLCFWFRLIIEGIIYVIREPIRWDSVNIIGERNMDFHGYQFKYSDGNIDLGFDCDSGRDLIEAVYAAKGQDGDIQLMYGYTYKGVEYLLFPGKLDLNTRKWFADHTECTVEAEDFDKTFQSRVETKVSMAQNTSFDNMPVVPPVPYNLELHAKEIYTQINIQNHDKHLEQDILVQNKFFYILPDTTNPVVADIEEHHEYELQSLTSNPLEIALYNVLFVSPGQTDVNISVDMDIRMTVHNGGIFNGTDYVVKLLYAELVFDPALNDFSLVITDITAVPVSGHVDPDSTPTIPFNISGTHTTSRVFVEKEAIYLLVAISFDRTVRAGFSVDQNTLSYVINHYELTKNTPAKVWLLDDVIRQTINVITNNKYTFRSTFFERQNGLQLVDGCGSKNAVVNGFQIRQFEVNDRPLVIDFKTIINSLKAQYCIGINYSSSKNTPIVNIERADFFYQERQILAIPEVMIVEGIAQYREEVAKEIVYNEVEIGYRKYASEGFNSLDEFNTTHQELTPIKKNAQKLSQLSDFITSGYSIELIRREQFSESPSTSVTNDDEPFFICLRRLADSSFVTEKNEAFESVQNLISPQTSYNLRVSPARLLYNWFIWLKGIFAYKQPADLIKTTYVAQNGALTTRFNITEPCLVGDLDRNIITEKADIPLSKLATTRNIYRPEWIYFTARITPDRIQILNLALSGKYDVAKDYGYVMVKKPDGSWQAGWVYKVSYNYWTEKAEIKMLKKFTTPPLQSETCCPWLVANGCYVLANDCAILMSPTCHTEFPPPILALRFIVNSDVHTSPINFGVGFNTITDIHVDYGDGVEEDFTGAGGYNIFHQYINGGPNQVEIFFTDLTALTELYLTGIRAVEIGDLSIFPSILIFYCNNNLLGELPPLPDSIVTMFCNNNFLTALPDLPSACTYLNCQNNQITVLPTLPPALTTLYCNDNPLTGLPALPTTLEVLIAINCFITSLPALPSGLTQLWVHHNQLTTLPALPSTLVDLEAGSNVMTTIPTLPASLVAGANGIQFTVNNLSVTQVSNALIQLDSYGTTNGDFRIANQSPAAVPNSAGQTAKTNLIAKGWNIETDT